MVKKLGSHNMNACYIQICGSVNPYKPSILFVGHKKTMLTQITRRQNAASDQGRHCLLTECSIKI